MELKEKQGLTISLGLPALNEEKTIGLVIKRVKSALMDRVPLLDQLVVIDSDSTDRTARDRRRPGSAGASGTRGSCPRWARYVGKGEALWKSLHVLDGDIVAWIDTDIRNIQPRFVHGLLGPLLREPRIQYVKGFYRRPIRQGVTALRRGRRTGDRADGSAADQPLLPRAVRHSSSRCRASTPAVARSSSRCRSSPATGSRSAS